MDVGAGAKQRPEEAESLEMIEMQVGQEDVQLVERLIASLPAR